MNTRVTVRTDSQNVSSSINFEKRIPSWIVWTQCACFAVLYAIWNYPLTNFLSDLCMIVGALLSTYILYINRGFFKTKQSIPFWLLILLLVWIVFHLLFLSNSFSLQLRELTSIWKRVSIAIIFALGLGIALMNTRPRMGYWTLFYFGMIMPMIIYFFKYYIEINSSDWGWAIPEYLKLHEFRVNSFYMYKVDYSSFIVPVVAISLGELMCNLRKNKIFIMTNLFYVLIISLCLYQFSLENIKNAVAYSMILISIFFILIFKIESVKLMSNYLKKKSPNSNLLNLILICLLGILLLIFLVKHIEQNQSWKSLLADSKVALKVDHFDHWKYWGAKGYPKNEMDNTVSASNYERIAWARVGLSLLWENPIGYGLAENSFGYFAKRNWPDSRLLQSHSGWLDLGLGIGVPGIFLLLSVFFIVVYRIIHIANVNIELNTQNEAAKDWAVRLSWVLGSIFLIWCTSEVSLKIYIITLFFWISLALGASISINKKTAAIDLFFNK
jgi:hypothetical protein